MKRFSCAIGLLLLCFFQTATAEETSIVVKNIEGAGENRQKALADAFQNAIRKAVGTYVFSSVRDDSETLDEKIYLNADAVVKNHTVIGSEATPDGFTIVIDAEIVRNEMMKYIQKEATTEVGEGELANLLAKRNAVNNAGKSLELIFMNWRENVYRVEKYGNLSIAADDDANGETVHVSIPFIVTFNWHAYDVFLSKVKNILSRIAIAKTGGEWNLKRNDGWGSSDFMEVLAPFYIKAGIAHTKPRADSVTDIEIENPNEYGVVEICSHIGNDRIKYELYVVPSQIKKTLDKLLSPEAALRFSFSSKGGATIASRSIAGEIISCGSGLNMWHHEADYFREISESCNLQVLSDKINLEFPSLDEWNECRLFHATVAVPLDAAQRISGCSISVQKRGEEQWGWERSIKSEAMQEAEWRRIDGKPMQAVKPTPQKPVATTRPTLQKGVASVASQPIAEAIPTRVITIKISEKDKALKDRVQDMVNLAPSVSSGGMWFKLSGEVESRELKQEMLKATGAALVYAKRGDAYQQRVRPLIADVSAFEAQFFVACPSCGGRKTVEGNCSTCAGTGRCKNANCRGGQHLVRQIQGSHYEICRECKGTGQCTKCHGTGKTQSRCHHCQGNGKSVSLDSVASAYRDSVDRISEAFQ